MPIQILKGNTSYYSSYLMAKVLGLTDFWSLMSRSNFSELFNCQNLFFVMAAMPLSLLIGDCIHGISLGLYIISESIITFRSEVTICSWKYIHSQGKWRIYWYLFADKFLTVFRAGIGWEQFACAVCSAHACSYVCIFVSWMQLWPLNVISELVESSIS